MITSTRTLLAGLLGLLLLQSDPALARDVGAESLTEIVVIGSRERLRDLPGAGNVIDSSMIDAARPFTVNEIIRQVPGVFARDEEGFGLRPNLGIRGLNPTRSSKVLLLEDGLPLAFAPYGDNASYYHPPIARFASIEVLKGASQIQFGPQTVGGVINYITADVPDEFRGALATRIGNRGFGELSLEVGDRLAGGAGWLANISRKETDGARDNMRFKVTDVSVKTSRTLSERQSLTLRASYYQEDSQVPYSGLTLQEYATDPRMNPFVNDRFDIDRVGVAATHGWQPGAETQLKTSVYYTFFNRDWWRQSSNSAQRPNDASDPACAGLVNLLTTCGNEGRLRQYYTAGVEQRLTTQSTLGGVPLATEFGARWHIEKQYRVQVNGDTPRARAPGVGPNAGVREDNRRDVRAAALFWQSRLEFGRLGLTPGLRYERIDYERQNFLNNARGSTAIDQLIPGLGATFEISDQVLLYAGAHRGFAPPRVEDLISPGGGSVELQAELSWNYELGLRAALAPNFELDVTAFRMDFANQIVPASVAGGIGAALTSAGETLHQGAELAVQFDAPLAATAWRASARLAYTQLLDAKFVGQRFSSVSGARDVLVTGNRLPYAAERLANASFGLASARGITLQVSANYTSSLYTDDLETVAVTADGQRGRIGGATVWNATAQYQLRDGLTMFASAKNLSDKLYVVDMSRGLIPGAPRLVQLGLDYRF
ncbi:MAG TPA: TonB-dependent receptor [Steroidobacteraceae bacterium]|nr:TonB-dependent receptor [Steroidobacteraceae bacterium]